MAESTRCLYCQGSGEMIGGGMIRVECDQCEGTGKPLPRLEIDYKKAKQTKSYKSAKARLKDKNSNLTDEAAEKILDAALEEEIN